MHIDGPIDFYGRGVFDAPGLVSWGVFEIHDCLVPWIGGVNFSIDDAAQLFVGSNLAEMPPVECR